MNTLNEEDHLDPNNPLSYAPRWMREEAKSRSTASGEAAPELPKRISPSSFDTFSEAVSKSLRNRLDPVAIHEPPGMSQWRELIPVAGRFAAAVGVSALVALFFVFMIPATREHAQETDTSSNISSNTSSSAPAAQEPMKAARQAPPEGETSPLLAEFETALTANRPPQPADPAMTHEQSEELLHQFVRWQQKLDSTDGPPQ